MFVKDIIKKIMKVIAAAVSSLFLAYLTLVFGGLYGMGMMPEKAGDVIDTLTNTNTVLAVIAIIVSFFQRPKWSFVIFGMQCLILAGVILAGSFLIPIEKEANLRANYTKINTRVIEQAEIILQCDEAYRVTLSPLEKTSLGKIIATMNLVPPDFEDEPLQIMYSVDGSSSDVFIKHNYKQLESILPSCKNDEFNFNDLVAKLKSY